MNLVIIIISMLLKFREAEQFARFTELLQWQVIVRQVCKTDSATYDIIIVQQLINKVFNQFKIIY